ncbi:MAG: glycosyltransferase family 2 protein [Candidatus Micrarchaeia archaeon]
MKANDYSDAAIIIPVKNEPRNAIDYVIGDVLKNLPGASIIVIYKGDAEIGKKYLKRIMLIKQKSDGKGAACYEASRHVDRDIMCFIDGDKTYHAKDLRKLINEVRNGADLAIGNRMRNLKGSIMPFYIRFGNKMLTLMLNLLYGTNVKDSQTGLRAIRKGAFDLLDMRERYFGFEEEMLIKAKRKNLRISELPISYSAREGTSKQFKPIDGLKLLGILFKHLADSK